MAVCSGNGLGLGFSDKALPIVPMFHANAWGGLPYAALMAGADLVLPDRFMDPTTMVNLIETQRPTVAGAVPTIWNDVMNYLDRNPGHDISSLRLVSCGGSAVPVSLMKAFEEKKFDVQIRQLWGGMTETSPIATLAWPPPGLPVEKQWEIRGGTQGRPMCGVEARIVDDEARCCPTTVRQWVSWRSAGRGSPAPTTATPTTRSSSPAGCAPATWGASTRRATSR